MNLKSLISNFQLAALAALLAVAPLPAQLTPVPLQPAYLGNGGDFIDAGTYSSISAAIAALGGKGGTVFVPSGTSTITSAIVLVPGLHLMGAGYASTLSACPTIIQSSGSDIFQVSAATSDVEISNLCAHSQTGGGHVLNVTGGATSRFNVHHVNFQQDNAAKSVILANTAASYFIHNKIRDSYIGHTGATTPTFNISNNAVNDNVFDGLWFQETSASTAYALYLNSTASGVPVILSWLTNLVFESANGGAISVTPSAETAISNVDVDTITGSMVNPSIYVLPNGSGYTGNEIKNCYAFSGTSTISDLRIGNSGANSNVVVIGSEFNYVDNGTGGGISGIVGLGNYIAHMGSTGLVNVTQFSDRAGSLTLPGVLSVGAQLDQVAAKNWAGECTMASTTSCSFTVSASNGITSGYNTTPICIVTPQGSTAIASSCVFSAPTVTIYAASSNSATWGAMLVGNPN